MTRKFISLATAIVILDVCLRSQLFSNDPLFLFTSNNLAVNIVLSIMALAVATVSFKKQFKHWQSFAVAVVGAVVLGSAGILGFFFSNIDYAFSSILLPLNYLFLLETGIILAICALSYKHEPVPSSYRLPRPAELATKLVSAIPVPRIPHSPTGYSRTSAPGAR